MRIYIYKNGKQHGPYTVDQIQAWLSSGQVQATDMAWHDGAANWVPLHALLEINKEQAAPTEQTTSSITVDAQPPLLERVSFPKFWIALFFPAAAFFLIALIWMDADYKIVEKVNLLYNSKYGFAQLYEDMTPLHSYAPFAAAIVMLGWAYWLYCVYRLHKATASMTNGEHAVSPARAVLFHLTPIYNLFWAFKWTGEFARSLNKNPYFVMPGRGPGAFLSISLFFQYTALVDITYLMPSAREAFRQATVPGLGREPYHLAFIVITAILVRTAAFVVAVLVGIYLTRRARALRQETVKELTATY